MLDGLGHAWWYNVNMKRKQRIASRVKLSSLKSHKLIIALGVFAITLGGAYVLRVSLADGPTTIKSVEKLGPVKNYSQPQTLYRDGGSSVRLGNKVLWLFGDTLFTQKSVDGTNARSNTAAWADISQPYRLSEPLDANGAPSQFIPYSNAEAAYNAASGDPNDRYVIWPTEAVNTDANSAYIYYMRLKSSPNPTTLVKKGIGLAMVRTGDSSARIINESVFSENEAQYRPTAVRGDTVYLRDCVQSGFEANCAMARVSKANMANRSAYEFWDGNKWQPDIALARHDVPGSLSTMATMWSEYAHKFVMISAPAFSRDLTIRESEEIQGPWSTPKSAYTDTTSKYPSILYFHPELSSQGGQSFVLTATQNYDSYLSGNDGIIAFRYTFDDKSITAVAPSLVQVQSTTSGQSSKQTTAHPTSLDASGNTKPPKTLAKASTGSQRLALNPNTITNSVQASWWFFVLCAVIIATVGTLVVLRKRS